MLYLSAILACGSMEGRVVTTSQEAAEAPASTGTRADIDLPAFVRAHAAGAPVLDVRTPSEFARGHVPGAVNRPSGLMAPDDPWLGHLEPDTPIYVICQSGKRSARAADTLATAGYHTVNVLGGTGAWVAAGHPVDK